VITATDSFSEANNRAVEEGNEGASIVLVKWLFLYFLYRQEIFLKA
jgi:hypothetical protein